MATFGDLLYFCVKVEQKQYLQLALFIILVVIFIDEKIIEVIS